MQEALRLIFPGSFVLAAIIALSFMAWFAFRDRPLWDTALFATASAAMAILVISVYLLGPLAIALAFSTPPSLVLYLWFWALRRARHLHAATGADGRGHFLTAALLGVRADRPAAQRRTDPDRARPDGPEHLEAGFRSGLGR